jgi:hypothetical protein
MLEAMRPWISRGALHAAALLLGLGACKDDPVRATPGPPCPEDAGCHVETAGAQGSTGAGGGGGVGGAAAGITVTGVVADLTTATFDQSTLYSGEATIQGDQAGGGTTTADYGGDAGTGSSFTLTNVAVRAGANWLLAAPTATNSAFDTYSAVLLPSVAPVTLPIVDREVLTTIAATLPSPVMLDDTASQIVLVLTRAGAPLAGVQLAATPVGAAVAYDQGPGVYSTDATATGAAGIVLLLNTPASNAQLDLTIELVDPQSGSQIAAELRARGGAATFARFAL